MKTLDLSDPITDLSGESLGETFASAVARWLLTRTTGNALKLYGWASDLHQSGKVEMDDADLEELRRMLTDATDITVLMKGPLLDRIHALQRTN